MERVSSKAVARLDMSDGFSPKSIHNQEICITPKGSKEQNCIWLNLKQLKTIQNVVLQKLDSPETIVKYGEENIQKARANLSGSITTSNSSRIGIYYLTHTDPNSFALTGTEISKEIWRAGYEFIIEKKGDTFRVISLGRWTAHRKR